MHNLSREVTRSRAPSPSSWILPTDLALFLLWELFHNTMITAKAQTHKANMYNTISPFPTCN